MNPVLPLSVILILLGAGCATPPPPSRSLDAARLAPDAFITQRAILTARGKEFTLNGYLARSQAGGLRLIVTEMLGQVLADVLVKPSGEVFVIRSSPMMRPAWIRHYVAADVACMFGGAVDETGAVQALGPDQFLVTRRWYKLYLRSIETRPSPQSPDLFDETKAKTP